MPSPDNHDFLETFQIPGGRPTRAEVQAMPSETYDHVWAKAGERTAANQFLTSDQCLGCHSAGGTGLQLDMTERGAGDQLINISPYGSWRGSPMGLSGRDPFFFAQLASETQVFHPQSAATIEDSCLGCHGVMGQRQFAIDRAAKQRELRGIDNRIGAGRLVEFAGEDPVLIGIDLGAAHDPTGRLGIILLIGCELFRQCIVAGRGGLFGGPVDRLIADRLVLR